MDNWFLDNYAGGGGALVAPPIQPVQLTGGIGSKYIYIYNKIIIMNKFPSTLLYPHNTYALHKYIAYQSCSAYLAQDPGHSTIFVVNDFSKSETVCLEQVSNHSWASVLFSLVRRSAAIILSQPINVDACKHLFDIKSKTKSLKLTLSLVKPIVFYSVMCI